MKLHPDVRRDGIFHFFAPTEGIGTKRSPIPNACLPAGRESRMGRRAHIAHSPKASAKADKKSNDSNDDSKQTAKFHQMMPQVQSH
jgi:hypothetical protein